MYDVSSTTSIQYRAVAHVEDIKAREEVRVAGVIPAISRDPENDLRLRTSNLWQNQSCCLHVVRRIRKIRNVHPF